MRIILTYFLLYLVQPGESVRDTEYCCTYCSHGRHTVCKYPRGGIGANCVRFVRGSLNDKERIALLHMHNRLRQLIAQGKISQQPPASNLVEMIWDDELEFIAKRWNDQCIYEHDQCRNSLRFDVGQNIAYNYARTAESMTQFWFDEYIITPTSYIYNMTDKETEVKLSGVLTKRDTGHFTQVVWANSYRLGCSVNVQFEIPFFKTTIMCDYGPAGNIIGTPVYKVGRGCSNCPVGTECSKVYPGLCALKCSKLYPFFCQGSGSASFPFSIFYIIVSLFASLIHSF